MLTSNTQAAKRHLNKSLAARGGYSPPAAKAQRSRMQTQKNKKQAQFKSKSYSQVQQTTTRAQRRNAGPDKDDSSQRAASGSPMTIFVKVEQANTSPQRFSVHSGWKVKEVLAHVWRSVETRKGMSSDVPKLSIKVQGRLLDDASLSKRLNEISGL